MRHETKENIKGLCGFGAMMLVFFAFAWLVLPSEKEQKQRRIAAMKITHRYSYGTIVSVQSVPRVIGLIQRQTVTCEKGSFVTSEDQIPIGTEAIKITRSCGIAEIHAGGKKLWSSR